MSWSISNLKVPLETSKRFMYEVFVMICLAAVTMYFPEYTASEAISDEF